MSRLPTPRLLPVTMLGMAGLLALKAAKLAQIGLLVGASATVVPAAQAVESPAPAAPAKTAAPPPPPGSLSPAPAPAQPAAAPSHAVTPTAGADPKAAEPATVSDSEMALLQDRRPQPGAGGARIRPGRCREEAGRQAGRAADTAEVARGTGGQPPAD